MIDLQHGSESCRLNGLSGNKRPSLLGLRTMKAKLIFQKVLSIIVKSGGVV